MSNDRIRAAFESRVKAWADAQAQPIPLAFPNTQFTPPEGRYARVFVMPAATESRSLERTDRFYQGQFRVVLVMPAGMGAGESLTLADSLDAAFPINAPMVQAGLSVWLTTPLSPLPAAQKSERYELTVAARYAASLY